MVFRVILIPFAIIISLFSIFFSFAKLLAVLSAMIIRFTFDRGFGAVFGAAGGLLLGRRHIKIKMF